MGRLLATLLLSGIASGPSLVLRASPRVSLAELSTGCAPVLLVAEILGPDTEPWYCPRVDWTWPDGTTSSTESDCPPYEARYACMEPQVGCGLHGWRRDAQGAIVDERTDCPCTIIGFPRRWTRYVCIPPHPQGEAWEIGVRLARGKATIATQRVTVTVK